MVQLCYAKSIVPTTNVEYISIIDDASSLDVDVRTITRLQSNFDRIRYVEAAYQEFAELKSKTLKPSRNGQIMLERRARSFFMEFDVFLDHWQKYISHHSKKTEFKELYKQLTNDAYDHSDDYAMSTILRNYVTHNANVIQSALWGSNVFDVGCSKNVLLNDRSFNKAKKEIIRR